MPQAKILCLFDYKSYTGFAQVSQSIMPYIKRHFMGKAIFEIIAINYFGESMVEEDGTIVHSAEKMVEKRDAFGRFGLLRQLAKNDYDIVFIIQDLGVINPILPLLKEINQKKKSNNRKQFRTIFYFPVDCHMIPILVSQLHHVDSPITYTEFGRKEILSLVPGLQTRLQVIPHGVDAGMYCPRHPDENAINRKRLFGDNAEKYIVANINRNQPRKDIPQSILAFTEFKMQHRQDAFLYLHMDPKDPMGYDLKAFMWQMPLKEGVDYAYLDPKHLGNGMPESQMAALYSCVDMYLTTSLGEGWGLGVTHAMSAGTPVVMGNHTSFTEISGNGERAWMVNKLHPHVTHFDNMIRYKLDIDETVERMVEVMQGNEYDKLEKARDYAESLTWRSIAKRFIEEIKKNL
jgi:glycosyltransferase involved in cell wall biosynthesis